MCFCCVILSLPCVRGLFVVLLVLCVDESRGDLRGVCGCGSVAGEGSLFLLRSLGLSCAPILSSWSSWSMCGSFCPGAGGERSRRDGLYASTLSSLSSLIMRGMVCFVACLWLLRGARLGRWYMGVFSPFWAPLFSLGPPDCNCNCNCKK